ncbi:MAG TPA: hypothetical protein VH374_08060 [Polyangia bacterium]|nr:hypothetical protein [Polyangia bacterium]
MLNLLRVTPLFVMLATPAVAAPSRPQPRVDVLPFTGDDGHLRAVVIRALRARHFQAVRVNDPSATTDGTAEPSGVSTAAFIDGRVKKRGWKSVLTVRIRQNPAGSKLGTAIFSGGRRQIDRDIARNLGRRVGRPLARATAASNQRTPVLADAHMEPIGQPAAAARPPPHASSDDVEDEPLAPRVPNDGQGEDSDDDDEQHIAVPAGGEPEVQLRQTVEPTAGTLGAQALDFSLGMHLFTRHFRYQDPVGTLTPYRLLWAPAPAAALDWFPVDLIGVTGSGQIETGATTTDRDGTAFPTSHWAFAAGIKVRYPLGAALLMGTVEYGVDTFRIDDADPDTPKPPVPSVRYTFARAELGVLVRPMSYLSLYLGGGYRHVFSAGEIESSTYFPHATVYGIDAAATIAVRLRRGLELRIAADLCRYQFEMRSQPRDTRMAGAAIDDYVGGTVSLAMLLGGRRGF